MGEGHQGTHKSRRQAIRRKLQRRHDRFYKHCSHWSVADATDGTASPIHWHHERWIVAATVALMVLLSAGAIPSWANAMKQANPAQPHINLSLALPPLPPKAQTPKPVSWHTVKVQPGQTLSVIFQSQGLGFTDVQQALKASKDSSMLHHLQPGDIIAFRMPGPGRLQALRFDSGPLSRITLHFDAGKVTRSVKQRPFEVRQRVAHGVIQQSLSAAAAKAGLSQALMVKLSHVFRHEINFRRDIRSGDRFTVVYSAVYRQGTYLHADHVLAAVFYNHGHRYTAFRYKLPNGHVGYYSAKGRPLSVSLLRMPVGDARISSPFGMRLDPVTHKYQLHEGVDFAVPKGTPIHAASRGVMTIHGWVHGYGRYDCIKLNATYTTCYAHMSRYAKGLHDGSHIHQGEVIGYVGMSGWATGPNLHYEVRIHGKPVNPLTVTMPKPKPLAPALLAKFQQHTRPFMARIQLVQRRVELAKAGTHGHAARASAAG